MNCEMMSDAELNIKLNEIVLNNKYPNAKSIEYDGRQNCFWVNSVGFSSFKVEKYCTDISATWPLMIEHGVSVNALFGGDYKAFEIYEKTGLHGNDIADEKGLLRAIVICLIKVLEAKK